MQQLFTRARALLVVAAPQSTHLALGEAQELAGLPRHQSPCFQLVEDHDSALLTRVHNDPVLHGRTDSLYSDTAGDAVDAGDPTMRKYGRTNLPEGPAVGGAGRSEEGTSFMAVVGGYEDLKVEALDDGVAVLTLNRPELLNAMRAQTRRELVLAFSALNADDGVGAVIIVGAGDKAFAAGQDLSESAQFTADLTDEWEASWNRLYHAMLDMNKPVVAAVHGYAVGAACHLTLLCDIRIGTEQARFGVAEIDDGIPCINGTLFLNEFVGRGRAAELVLTGRMIDAQTALAWGILNRVVTRSELMPVATAEARLLASKPKHAMMLDKRWMRELLVDKLAKSYAFGVSAQANVFGTGQPQEKMSDFLEKNREGRST